MSLLQPETLHSFLIQMRREDPAFWVFGANAHRYQLNPPLVEEAIRNFELEYTITLPAEYRHFLSVFGNGGAGPYYGLLPLAETTEWCDPSRPFPFRGRTRPRRQAVDRWANDGVPGVLAIADRGCVQSAYLVLHGPNRGAIWNGLDALHLVATSFTAWYTNWMMCVEHETIPILRRELVTLQIVPGMSSEDVARICGGVWRQRIIGARRFLVCRQLKTLIELDQNNLVLSLLPGWVGPQLP